MKQRLLFLLLGISLSASAQSPAHVSSSGRTGTGSISGIVLDSVGQKPVEFATVGLLNAATNEPGTGITTDMNGQFSFQNVPPGTYRLVVSFVGYENRTNSVVISSAKPAITLAPVLLKTTSQTLGEVTVTAQRDLIEDKEDRLVYNAGNDPSNAGGTAIDVMKKVPLLTVDPDGSIQLKGSSSIKVLINNKPSSIMARSISEALQMIPAESIKSVEVITAPSAKYDAEGTAGIINIVTKSRLQGLTGGLNGSVGNRSNSLGGNLNLRRGKMGLTAYGGGNTNLNYGGSESIRRSRLADQSVSELRQISANRNQGGSGYGSFNLDYDLDSTNQFGVDGSFSAGSRSGYSTRDTRYASTEPRQPFRRYTDNASGNSNVDANVNYTRLFKRPDQNFTFLAQVNRSDNDSRYALNQFILPENEVINYRERNTNRNLTSEFTVQTDYAHPFMKGKKTLEVGIKSIRRNVSSDYRLENATDSTGFREDPRRANQFDYQQWVVSSYASFRLVTSRRWTFTVGGRYELTRIDANFVSTQTTFADQYRNFMPNLAISKRLPNNQRIRLSYNQRIQRPSIQFLNPYINSTDLKNLSFGNPYLNPELAHSIELTHSLFTKKGLSLNTMLFSRLTNNSIERITTVDTANVSYNTYQNIGKNATYGLNLFGSGRPRKGWQMNGSVGLNYNVLSSAALRIQNTNWSYRLTLNTSLALANNYSLQAQGSYNSARIQLQGQSTGFYNYGVSARKEFRKQKVIVTVNAENPFARYNVITNQFRTATFITDGFNYTAYRNLRLSANWRFGRMEAKAPRTRKRIDNDDKKTSD